MATKRRKPKYEVDVSLQAWDIAKAGAAITIKVHDRAHLLGTIEIGQGSFRWKSAHAKRGFRRIPWRTLTEKLDSL